MGARILGIGGRNLAPGGTPAGQSAARIALTTAVGDVIFVTEHAPEVLRNVGATVPAGRRLVTVDEFQHTAHLRLQRHAEGEGVRLVCG